jgi:putative ABC transport system permease protein
MLMNFLKVAWRSMLRGRSFTLINLSGLTIGMASALLILLWVQNELSFDREWAHSDRLYQAWNQDRGNEGIETWNITPTPLGPALKRDYPEVEKATRLNWDRFILFSVGDKKINLKGTMADPDFLTMFRFPFEQGDASSALNRPNDIVLTRHAATTLFGDADPMGKIVRLDNKYDMTVTGVMKDLPGNTQFDFEYVLPWTYMRWIGLQDNAWDQNSTHTHSLVVDAPMAGGIHLSRSHFRVDLSTGGYGRVIDRAVYGELSGDQGCVDKSRNEFAFRIRPAGVYW